jgi:YidC/Oxa1 family membrane protein insertase
VKPDGKKEETTAVSSTVSAQVKEIKEQEITVEKENYKIVFSNKGASIKNWFIREKNGSFVDLVLPEAAPVLGNFPGSVYEITEQTKDKVTFLILREKMEITKTYNLSDNYLHKLDGSLKN